MAKFYAARNIRIGGRWISVGDEIDVTGFRPGAITAMLDRGDIFADSATAGGGEPEDVIPPVEDEDPDLDPDDPGYVPPEPDPVDELPGSINGQVLSTTGEPVEGAEVATAEEEPKLSDAEGKFFFDELEPGEYEVTASKEGFLPGSRAVEVARGKAANCLVTLSLEVVEPPPGEPEPPTPPDEVWVDPTNPAPRHIRLRRDLKLRFREVLDRFRRIIIIVEQDEYGEWDLELPSNVQTPTRGKSQQQVQYNGKVPLLKAPGSQTALEFTTSDGGLTWHMTLPGLDDVPPAEFVALGANGTIYFSWDGEDWHVASQIAQDHVGVLKYADGYFLAGTLGDTRPGKLYRSRTGFHWSEVFSGQEGYEFHGIAKGSRWVAVGGRGERQVIVSSPNLASFTTRNSDAPTLRAATAGAALVAVGDGGEVRRSTNGLSWTTHAAGSDDLLDVTHHDGLYVAVGKGGVIQTSPDGQNWTARTSGVSADLTSVIRDGTQFVALGTEVILTSADGTTWTDAAFPGSDTGDLIYTGSEYLATASQDLYSSEDLVSWSPVTL